MHNIWLSIFSCIYALHIHLVVAACSWYFSWLISGPLHNQHLSQKVFTFEVVKPEFVQSRWSCTIRKSDYHILICCIIRCSPIYLRNLSYFVYETIVIDPMFLQGPCDVRHWFAWNFPSFIQACVDLFCHVDEDSSEETHAENVEPLVGWNCIMRCAGACCQFLGFTKIICMKHPNWGVFLLGEVRFLYPLGMVVPVEVLVVEETDSVLLVLSLVWFYCFIW